MSLVVFCHSGDSRLTASRAITLQNFYQHIGCEKRGIGGFCFSSTPLGWSSWSERRTEGSQRTERGWGLPIEPINFSLRSLGRLLTLRQPWEFWEIARTEGFRELKNLSLTNQSLLHISARFATFQPAFCFTLSFLNYCRLECRWGEAEPQTAGYVL